MLTEDDLTRYARQLLIPGWGEETQRRLQAAKVFVAGAGGLGSAVLYYLLAVGVGRVRVCDSDNLSLDNLNRQILYQMADLQQPKAPTAAARLRALNPKVEVEPLATRITAHNAEELVADSHIIVDCLDNFETRYLLNEVAVRRGLPMVYAGVQAMEGMLSFLHPPATPCLRCVFPQPPIPPPDPTPIVGATSGVIGTLQALEVIKHLTGLGQTLRGRLLIFDGADLTCTQVTLKPMPNCPACGGAGAQ
jgi:molybdopterin/thiamine biosynthesis adenylyltransferase